MLRNVSCYKQEWNLLVFRLQLQNFENWNVYILYLWVIISHSWVHQCPSNHLIYRQHAWIYSSLPLNTKFSYKYYIKYKVLFYSGDTFHTACFAPDPDPFFAPDTCFLLTLQLGIDWYFKQRSIPRTNDRPKLVQPFLFQQIFLLDLNEGTSKWAIISQFSFPRQLEFRVLWNAKTSKIHSS